LLTCSLRRRTKRTCTLRRRTCTMQNSCLLLRCKNVGTHNLRAFFLHALESNYFYTRYLALRGLRSIGTIDGLKVWRQIKNAATMRQKAKRWTWSARSSRALKKFRRVQAGPKKNSLAMIRWREITADHWVTSVAFSPDGQKLATGSRNSDSTSIKLWHAKTSACLGATKCPLNTGCKSVAFLLNGDTMAVCNGNYVLLLSVDPLYKTRELLGHTHHINSVAISPSNKILASGACDKTVRLWCTATGACLHTLTGHKHNVQSVAFSGNGKMLASGSSDLTVRLWHVTSYNCVSIFQGHTDWVRAVAFSPCGTLLASGSDDATVRLWSVETTQCIDILRGHGSWIRSVAFAPNGKTLASGSDDRTVCVWNVETRQRLRVFCGHTNWVWSVAFAPNGKTLASGGDDGKLRLWSLLEYDVLCNAALLLRVGIAPYVALDIVYLLLAAAHKTDLHLAATHMHYAKLLFIVALQKRRNT